MRIKSVRLKGYRNFKDATINFAEKSLIIGCNEIGKTNLLYALRILLDRTLSEVDIEPKDSDFFAFEPTNDLEINIEFEDITEECIIAKLREHISDDGHLILTYHAVKHQDTKGIDYSLLIGKDEKSLSEIDTRYYLKTLNLKFIGSRRNLLEYIRQERKNLLQEAKDRRQEDDIIKDNETLADIENDLSEVNESVAKLSYVDKATEGINAQLNELSYRNQAQKVVFDVGASDPSQFVDQLHLASRVKDSTVLIGGDGRNNQIHLALWSARNKMRKDNNKEPLEIYIFCIEEPEAHLHPHQQRKLAQYLFNTLEGQVILTTHSPQIACKFPPGSIIRLYSYELGTQAAGNGVNPFTEAAFIEFGYRLNIIPAEAFFADVIFLVEGPSEELFYKALSKEVGIDLDRLNISVLKVDGVGFKPYISLLSSLKIPFVVRTDNDIFKVSGQDIYRFAGIQRAIELYRLFYKPDKDLNDVLEQENMLQGFNGQTPPQENMEVAKRIALCLEKIGIYISDIDLENDLHSLLPDATSGFLGIDQGDDVIYEMQKRKATFMFDFLRQKTSELDRLKGTSIYKPLLHCQKIAEDINGTPANA